MAVSILMLQAFAGQGGSARNASYQESLCFSISGCPNNCAHSAVADIGLSGMLKTIDGKRQEVYQVLLNGGNGMTDKLSVPDKIIPAEQLPSFIQSL